MRLIRRRNAAGFTLIELIAVLVVLGILSGFAMSRFDALRTSAEASVLEGLMGAAMSQCNIEHGRLTLSQGDASMSDIANNAADNILYDDSRFQQPEFTPDNSSGTITITVAFKSGQGGATLAPATWQQP